MIRKAEEKDIDVMLKLLVQVCNVHAAGRPDIFKAGKTKYNADSLAKILDDENRPIFVHENETGEVDGYCFCEITTTHGDANMQPHRTLYIDDLCVDENTRNGGVGKALFRHVREYAKEIGCYNLTLNVWQCNPSARAFYDKMGLTPMKTTLETII